jgi:HAD superfamily hydrolase (TIGR01509 family)
MMGMLKTILWDYDGTLANSHNITWQSYDPVFAKYGKHFSLPEIKVRLGGRDYKQFMLEDVGVPKDELESAIKMWDEEFERNLHKVHLFPGVTYCLERLALEKKTMCVASGGNRTRVLKDLEKLGIIKYFQTVVTRDDVSRAKPFGDIVELALKRSNSPPGSSVYVDDTADGMLAAHAAGTRAIGVEWGAGTEEELRAAGADEIVDSFSKLMEKINSM